MDGYHILYFFSTCNHYTMCHSCVRVNTIKQWKDVLIVCQFIKQMLKRLKFTVKGYFFNFWITP